jgi:hypothetical protein
MTQSSSNAFSIQVKPAPSASVPAWVPPPGFFADVPMTNKPADVLPEMYRRYPGDTGPMDNPFQVWGGSAILRDYSELGAQVYYSAGHEASTGFPNIQMSVICDFSTLRWSVANLPLQANIANSFINGYAADGTPYCPHTYLGLQEWPAGWGGAARGSLLSFFWAGSTWENRINVLDVSRPTQGYGQMATRQAQNADPTKIRFAATGNGGNHPITVMDEVRQGWWVAVTGNVAYTLFVKSSGDITQYPALGGNLQNGALVLCPSLNLLVAIDGGYLTGQYASGSYRKLYVRHLGTQAASQSTTLGQVPSLVGGYDGTLLNYYRPDMMGLQWVEELGCIVGLDQAASPPQLVKLTPPAADPANNPWTWSVVPALQHWSGDAGGQPVLQTALNGIWSKFRWVPTLHAFVYCTDRARKPQVLRLA